MIVIGGIVPTPTKGSPLIPTMISLKRSNMQPPIPGGASAVQGNCSFRGMKEESHHESTKNGKSRRRGECQVTTFKPQFRVFWLLCFREKIPFCFLNLKCTHFWVTAQSSRDGFCHSIHLRSLSRAKPKNSALRAGGFQSQESASKPWPHHYKAKKIPTLCWAGPSDPFGARRFAPRPRQRPRGGGPDFLTFD